MGREREREGVEKFRAGLDHLHIVGIQEQENQEAASPRSMH